MQLQIAFSDISKPSLKTPPAGPGMNYNNVDRYRYSRNVSEPSLRLRKAIIGNNYTTVTRILKQHPSLLDNIDPSNGWSNLHYSAFHNNYEICEYILKSIHARFISSCNKSSDTSFAQHFKNPDSLLYTQITDEDEIKLNFEKQTVLHVACLGDSASTLNLLLSYFNVCLDQRDIKGLTASHICCIKGFSDCLAILLENDAYPNIQDNEGDTLLHKAFQFSQLKCLELLIKYNADDQLYNNAGWQAADVAFDNETIEDYKYMKLNKSSQSLTINIDIANKFPSNKYGSIKLNQNNPNSAAIISSNNSTPTPDFQTKVNLPSIQSRKYSLSSMKSDDYIDKFDGNYSDIRSVNSSSKTSRNSSPTCSISTKNLSSLRKIPMPTTSQDLLSITSNNNTTASNISIASISSSASNKRYTQPLPIAPIQTNLAFTSPRRSTVSSQLPQQLESPISKRSSLSTRTFRSNSQLSDISPVKNIQSQTISENSGSNLTTPKYASFQSSYRNNNSYPFSLQEEASSKLQDFKMKNSDRLKLDTKLGNIINNTSQENLVSPTLSQYNGAGSSVNDAIEFKSMNNDPSKRSKVLSIPILSSRRRNS